MRIVITYQHRGDDEYLKLIDLAFSSAKRLGYETILVGDIEAGDRRLCFPSSLEPHLMNWVLAAQLAYINSPVFDCNSVIFSPDALIAKPLDEIFDLDFDVAFTNRDNKRWPINNGVIFLKPEKRLQIAKLWEDARVTCKAYPIGIQDWYGDQQALHDVVLAKRPQLHGIKPALLPCDVYNASPRYGEEFDANLIESAYIVHLKGKRKHLMRDYWDLICNASLK